MRVPLRDSLSGVGSLLGVDSDCAVAVAVVDVMAAVMVGVMAVAMVGVLVPGSLNVTHTADWVVLVAADEWRGYSEGHMGLEEQMRALERVVSVL